MLIVAVLVVGAKVMLGVTAVTVSVAELLVTLPETALIVVDPVVSAVASPVVLIVATAGAEELHVAVPVRSCVLASV